MGLVADSSVTPLTTELMVLARNVTSGERFLFAIEYATGAVTSLASLGPLAAGLPPTPDDRFVIVRKSLPDGRLFSTDPLGTAVLQLSPPQVQTDSTPIVFAPDSSIVLFCDSRQTNVSGLYASPVRTAGAAVRLSPASQVNGTISDIVVSADNLRVAYLFRAQSDPAGTSQTIFVALLRGAPDSAVPLQAAVVPASDLAFSLAGSALAYLGGPVAAAQQLYSVDAAADSGNVRLSLGEAAGGAFSISLFSEAGDLVVFAGQFMPQSARSFYAARIGAADSQYVLTNNTEQNVQPAAHLVPGTTTLVTVYRSDAGEQGAVWGKDIALSSLADVVRLSPPTSWPVTVPFIGSFGPGLVTFVGSFSSPATTDSYYNVRGGPGSAAVQLTPPGSQSASNQALAGGRLLLTVNSTVAFLVTAGSPLQPAITRAGDRIRPPLRVQPNGVSALYQLQSTADFVATCIVPPIVVTAGTNASVSSADGHVFVSPGGTLVVASGTVIAGTLVASGGTLAVPCAAGTQVRDAGSLVRCVC